MRGRPLLNPSEITDPMALSDAMRALLYGDDEDPDRSTESRGWAKNTNEIDDDREVAMHSFPLEWIREMKEIDEMISEEVCAAPTPLPTENILEKIDDMTEKLASWFSTPLPVYHARVMRYAFDEMSEVGSLLRSGVINAGEAGNRFDAVMNEVSEIVDFSRFEV